MFSSWFTFRKWTHRAAHVHALDVRVENSKILQFLGPNIRWHQWRSGISLQILNVHERLHSCTFIFWTYVDVRLRLLQHLDVRAGMAKDRRPSHISSLPPPDQGTNFPHPPSRFPSISSPSTLQTPAIFSINKPTLLRDPAYLLTYLLPKGYQIPGIHLLAVVDPCYLLLNTSYHGRLRGPVCISDQ